MVFVQKHYNYCGPDCSGVGLMGIILMYCTFSILLCGCLIILVVVILVVN